MTHGATTDDSVSQTHWVMRCSTMSHDSLSQRVWDSIRCESFIGVTKTYGRESSVGVTNTYGRHCRHEYIWMPHGATLTCLECEYVYGWKEPYKRDDILQKRPIIVRSLLIVATPYGCLMALHWPVSHMYSLHTHTRQLIVATPYTRTPIILSFVSE